MELLILTEIALTLSKALSTSIIIECLHVLVLIVRAVLIVFGRAAWFVFSSIA